MLWGGEVGEGMVRMAEEGLKRGWVMVILYVPGVKRR